MRKTRDAFILTGKSEGNIPFGTTILKWILEVGCEGVGFDSPGSG
jgi:hypothetical protein